MNKLSFSFCLKISEDTLADENKEALLEAKKNQITLTEAQKNSRAEEIFKQKDDRDIITNFMNRWIGDNPYTMHWRFGKILHYACLLADSPYSPSMFEYFEGLDDDVHDDSSISLTEAYVFAWDHNDIMERHENMTNELIGNSGRMGWVMRYDRNTPEKINTNTIEYFNTNYPYDFNRFIDLLMEFYKDYVWHTNSELQEPGKIHTD